MGSVADPAPTTRRPSNLIGTASLVAGVLLVLASIAAQTIVPMLPLVADNMDFSYRTLPRLMSLASAILATIATALGIIGLPMRDRARVPAIVGTTLGALSGCTLPKRAGKGSQTLVCAPTMGHTDSGSYLHQRGEYALQ